MLLSLWMSRRSSGMPQRTPYSWARRPSSVRENRKSQLQLRVGFCVLGYRLLDMLTRDAPRASTDGRGTRTPASPGCTPGTTSRRRR